MKKKNKIALIISLSVSIFLIVSVLIGLVLTGLFVEWGPFSFLAFDYQEKNILKKYDVETRQNEIVFYGASNFRLWKEMDDDMSPFIVQNHGFGGSTDRDLMERADRLLYPYNPQIVVFQTGSNDYAKKSGSDEEKLISGLNDKKTMFEIFHEKLPTSQFIVMAGILMPGRSQYDNIVKQINIGLKEYASTCDYVTFADSEPLTINEDGSHKTEYFISDGIHLTHEARLIWANEYIKPALNLVIDSNNFQGLIK